jgi:hypothetical protein
VTSLDLSPAGDFLATAHVEDLGASMSLNNFKHHNFNMDHCSVPDPSYFGTYPDANLDPRIRTSDYGIRMRIRIRSKIFSDFKDAIKIKLS